MGPRVPACHIAQKECPTGQKRRHNIYAELFTLVNLAEALSSEHFCICQANAPHIMTTLARFALSLPFSLAAACHHRLALSPC